MATSILAWKIPMDRGAWWATVHGVAELDTTDTTEHACMSVQPIEYCIHDRILLPRLGHKRHCGIHLALSSIPHSRKSQS